MVHCLSVPRGQTIHQQYIRKGGSRRRGPVGQRTVKCRPHKKYYIGWFKKCLPKLSQPHFTNTLGAHRRLQCL